MIWKLQQAPRPGQPQFLAHLPGFRLQGGLHGNVLTAFAPIVNGTIL